MDYLAASVCPRAGQGCSAARRHSARLIAPPLTRAGGSAVQLQMANGLWGPKDREATAGAQDAEPPSSDDHPLLRANGAGAGALLPAAHAGAGALDPTSPESRLRADLQECLAPPGRGASARRAVPALSIPR